MEAMLPALGVLSTLGAEGTAAPIRPPELVEAAPMPIDLLRPVQLQALHLLLEGMTKAETARTVGIGKTTLHHWFSHDENFAAAYRNALDDIRTATVPLLIDGFRKGISRLIDLCETSSQKIALGAASQLCKLYRPEPIAAVAGDSIGIDTDAEWARKFTTKGDAFLPHDVQLKAINCLARYLVLVAGVQSGKALPVDEPVRTPTGWVRIGGLKPGDKVIGGTGKPCRVLGVYPQGERDVFRLTFEDGAQAVCTDDHLWRVKDRTARQRRESARYGEWSVLRLGQIRERWGDEPKSVQRVAIPVCSSEGEWRALPVDPYVMGILLSEGAAGRAVRFSSADSQIVTEVGARLPIGHEIKDIGGADWLITGPAVHGMRRRNAVKDAWRVLGLDRLRSWEKFIPRDYLDTTEGDRRELLAGLLDGDGTCGKGGHVTYTTTSPRLRDDVVELIRSLGGKASWVERRTTYRYKGEKREGRVSYRVRVRVTFNPFKLRRKARRWFRPTSTPDERLLYKVEPAGRADCVCIAVDDPTETFVTRDYVVTHNTETAAINFWKRIVKEDDPTGVYYLIAPTTSIGKVMRKRFVARAPKGWLPHPQGHGQEFERTWILKNGATVEFRSANKPEQIVAETLNGAWLDEFTLMRSAVWHVSLRGRFAATGGWAIFSGTPRGPNWAFEDVWRRTVPSDDLFDAELNWQGYTWHSSANPRVSAAEVEDAKKTLPDAFYRREWQASWEAFHGQVFPDFTKTTSVYDLTKVLVHKRAGDLVDAGVDWGYGKPGALVVGRYNIDGSWDALHEVHEAKKLNAWWIERFKEAHERFGIHTFWCDGAEPDRIMEARRALRKWAKDNGLPVPRVRSAKKARWPGIRHVAKLFKAQRARVHIRCEVLVSQLLGYKFKEDRQGDDLDEIEKGNNHTVDAFRYMTYSRHRSGRKEGKVVHGSA